MSPLALKISDPLLEQGKRIAARDGITVRALVELGLRRARKRGGASAGDVESGAVIDRSPLRP